MKTKKRETEERNLMRFYLAKMYAKGDCSRIDDKVYYGEIGKKAIVKGFDKSHWRCERYRKTISGDEYSAYLFHIFFNKYNVADNEVLDLINEIIQMEDIENVKCVDIEEANINETLYEHCAYSFDNKIRNYGNLWELGKFARCDEIFYDWIANDKVNKSKLKKLAKDTANSTSLSAEIDKIYSMGNSGCVKDGIPVHYIIEGSNKKNYLETVDLLIGALKKCNRTYTSHVFKFNLDNICEDRRHRLHFDSLQDLYDSINENLAYALKGNPVVIEYGLDERNDDYNMEAYVALCKFIDILKPISYCTPIIFSIPENCSDLAPRIQKLLDMPCVHLNTDKKYCALSKTFNQNYRYLENKAKEIGIKTDKHLTEMLKERMDDSSFSDADKLFEEWFNENLIDNKFPEYADTLSVIKELRTNHETDAISQLDELIGLKQVKKQIKDFIDRFNMNEELKKSGLPTDDFSMHMAFLGNPGTGKTEVAKLFGQIFKEAGILKENRVVMVNGSQTFSVREVFKKAKGSVLFIDEAYALGGFGVHRGEESCLASLVAEMENNREDTVVILAGYKFAMKNLIASNVGFSSRLGFVLEFPDYSQDELLEIFKLFAKRKNKILSKEVIQDARDILWRGGRRSDQGNARFVRKFFEDCCGNQLTRIAKEHKKSNKPYTNKELRTILPCDLNKEILAEKSGIEQLDELIGLHNAKKLLNERISQLEIQKLRRDKGIKTNFIPMHMAFAGNPGTGKTEVARIVGKILNEKGLLSSGEFYETHPGELLYIHAFDDLFQKARGSVIFIDEAYSIMHFPQILIAELIKNMEDYRDETVVIFAGYSNEIKSMLKSNPGFESRVKEIVNFDDYDIPELVKIMNHMATKESYIVSKSAYCIIESILKKAKKDKRFGNGRFVRNLLEKAIVKQSVRLKNVQKKKAKLSKTELKTLLDVDFESLNKIKNTDGNIGFIKNRA